MRTLYAWLLCMKTDCSTTSPAVVAAHLRACNAAILGCLGCLGWQAGWLPLCSSLDPGAAGAGAGAGAGALPAGRVRMEWPKRRLAAVVVDIVVCFKWVGANSQARGRVDWRAARWIETETIVPLATMCLERGRDPPEPLQGVGPPGRVGPWATPAGAYCYSWPVLPESTRQPMVSWAVVPQFPLSCFFHVFVQEASGPHATHCRWAFGVPGLHLVQIYLARFNASCWWSILKRGVCLRVVPRPYLKAYTPLPPHSCLHFYRLFPPSTSPFRQHSSKNRSFFFISAVFLFLFPS